ncbi:hypothetical protein VTI74DRAFT_3249 [Chaetomium olivicolor]
MWEVKHFYGVQGQQKSLKHHNIGFKVRLFNDPNVLNDIKRSYACGSACSYRQRQAWHRLWLDGVFVGGRRGWGELGPVQSRSRFAGRCSYINNLPLQKRRRPVLWNDIARSPGLSAFFVDRSRGSARPRRPHAVDLLGYPRVTGPFIRFTARLCAGAP